MSDNLPDITLQRNRARFGTFSWQGQAPQYDQLGPPNEIVYRRYFDGRPLVGKGKATIDTLLHYDEAGHLDGILNIYPYGARESDGKVLQEPDSSVITIRPDPTPDGGVRAALYTEAHRRWPNVVEDDCEVVYVSEKHSTKIATTTAWQMSEDGNRRVGKTYRERLI